MKRFKKKTIAEIGHHALSLCGFEPYGDAQSIRHRLAFARSEIAKLTEIANSLEEGIPGDEYIAIWRHEAEVWEYAIKKGEKLLEKVLKENHQP